MGNSALSRFVNDVAKEPTASAGHMQMWDIRDGVNKASGEKVSVWTFDKSDLSNKEKMSNKARILGARPGDEELPSRAAQEQIFSIMLRDMKQMIEASGNNTSTEGLVRVVGLIEVREYGLGSILYTVVLIFHI